MNHLLVLQALAEARALLFRCCEYEDLGEAIGPVLAYAHTSGLAEAMGWDAVHDILKAAFGSDWIET
jgi:hypothetical protein